MILPVIPTTPPETPAMRQRILLEATRLFTVNGYSAASMREIAAACHITKAALYYHFTNKEDLIAAILGEHLNEIQDIIRTCKAASPYARERVNAFVSAIFRQPSEKRSIIRLASQEMPNLTPAFRADFGRRYYEQFIGALTGILKEGIQRGEIRPCDPTQAVWVLLGMMYPFFTPNQEPAALDSVADLITQIFFNGIAPAHE